MLSRRPPGRPAHDRAGFTLIEVVIASVLVALLAGVLITQLLPRLAQGQAAALAQNLGNISEALLGYRGTVGRYPGQLRDLSNPLESGATDLCGRPIPDPDVWRGPYLSREVGVGGIPAGPSTIRNQLERVPSTYDPAAPNGTLFVVVEDVDRDVAEQVDQAFDADDDLGAGSIRWSVQAEPVGELRFAVPVRGC